MYFEVKVATRYLRAARLQSALLVAGVAVGVLVFTFIAALINGLGDRLVRDVTGKVAHITLEAGARLPNANLSHASSSNAPTLVVALPNNAVRPAITQVKATVAVVAALPGVRAVVPSAVGPGTVARGDRVVAAAISGINIAQVDDIAPLTAALVRGRMQLAAGDMVIGSRMAAELGVDVGDRLVLTATQSAMTLTVRGVFQLGVQAVDERSVYVDLFVAQRLLGLADGVTQLDVKLADVWAAPSLTQRLSYSTGLKASNWIDKNASLRDGLKAQASTADMIKFFSLLTIAIGVASALFLSVSRRRAEIGIMRSFGISRRTIIRTFVLQGVIIGLTGAALGALAGYGFAQLLQQVSVRADGTPGIPIDPLQGEYTRAIVLATVASAIAAILPARAAARIDPLLAINT